MVSKIYCNSLTQYSRYKTRVVTIGDVPMGGENPVRIQSMTTTDTMDTLATVQQSIRMIEAGCEYVRITAPSIKEAQNLENIKKELLKRGYKTPLIADIHFTPNAAELAARIVEKVRVNPGNYADKKKFESIDYSGNDYEKELERIRERFTPLVKICKEYGTAMRIGTNHGSLSDRILSRYGDTPLGMVESALEFLRICEDNNYFNIVLSMKASNTQVMVQAYRLLIITMQKYNMNYPLHLGVTEAGEGEDGRIKSAVGIGTLLEDGIGDTIRVSLTEDPEFEIPVAKNIVERYSNRNPHKPIPEIIKLPYSPYDYKRRETKEVLNFGGHNVPRVIADFSKKQNITPATFFAAGYNYSVPTDKWNLTDQACDYVFVGDNNINFQIPGTLGLIYNAEAWSHLENKTRCYPLFNLEEYIQSQKKSEILNFVSVTINEILQLSNFSTFQLSNSLVFVLETDNKHGMAEQRRAFMELMQGDLKIPVIIKRSYQNISEEKFQLHVSTDIGALFLDGFGDGIWIEQTNCTSPKNVNSTAFGILQATRTRISKTEYISCPSCGRTLFDLQETTAKIRLRTDHLKGIKIGIMGCIVNGPGEMADADYGYVGTGIGKITLYKGREVVERNINSENAVDALIDLIKKYGDWVEKE
ncbi:MAG: 4-hydroxy-3-methylbut-2-en-1-yl diphosphate synthase [Bacteroidetes bacterium RIFCSPLOWO2_12_FULL_35_15]|nr:MAG: 4-hydroxy-3-methylbut-2-en-1-yl diphosphate synthase [Bacteroidetes bacterium RIFCSPLOWO2_12_FULL_35_15]